MRKLAAVSVLVCILLSLNSCSWKRMTYLQDLETLTTYDVTEAPDVKIRKNDRIRIHVGCTNPVLAAPFNLADGASNVDITTGTVSTAGISLAPDAKGVEYLVDKNGEILFPVLGSIPAEGLTIDQLKDEIASRIVEKRYITDPIVTAEFTNFQITMLGEVSSKGNYVVKEGKVSIFQAIAMAGDLTTAARYDDVWVIRTEGKERQVYNMDLLSKSCFDSPGFWLQQDDIVYVKPRKSKMDANAQLGWQIGTTAVSVLSAIGSIAYWISVVANH